MAKNQADQRIILDTEIDSQGFKKGSAEMQKAIKSLSKSYSDIGKSFEKSTKGLSNSFSKFSVKSAEKELKRLQRELRTTENDYAKLKSKDGAYNMQSLKDIIDAFKGVNGRTPTKEELFAVNPGYAETYEKALRLIQKQDELKAKIASIKQEIENVGASSSAVTGQTTSVFSRIKSDIAGIVNAMREAPPLSQQIATGYDNAEASARNMLNRIFDGMGRVALKIDSLPVMKIFDFVDVEKIQDAFNHPKAAAQSFISSVQSGFNTIKSKAGEIGERLKYAFQNPKETISALVNNIGQKFSELGPKMQAGFQNAATSLNQRLGQVAAGAKALGGNIKGYIVVGLGAAVRGAGQLASRIGSAALSGAKRLGNAVKNGVVNALHRAVNGAKQLVRHIGSRLVSGIKKATSGFSGMHKSADGIVKKITKMGLALLGMRGIWGGIRQIVSSALNNNKELQSQLTAVKGVLGQALAPAINVLVKGLGQIVAFADKLYQIFTGTSLIAQYNASAQQSAADSLSDQEKNAKKLKRQLAGFDSLNILSDNSDDSSSSGNGDAASLFKATNISGWLSDIIDQIKNGDWYGVGETIAGGINSALAKINWSSIQDKVNTFCTNLGNAVNGFVNALDWELVGNTIGEGINTITGGINSFVDTVNWNSLGAGISAGLNSVVDSIDGNALGKTLSAKLKILTETLYGFFNGDEEHEGFNFKNLGTKIGETVNGWFNNINWSHIGSNITSAIAGIGDTIAGACDEIDWTGIAEKIEDFFGGMDWSTAVSKLMTGLGKAIGGISSLIAKLICDAFGSISDYFDSQIEDAGGNVIKGVFNGIVNWLKDVGTWIYDNILKPFIDGFKSTFDIHSPSKNPTILELGENIIIGVFNGIVNWMKDIKQWIQTNVFDKVTDAIGKAKQTVIEITGKFVEDAKNKAKDLKSKIDSISSKTAEILAKFKEDVKNKKDALTKKIDSIKEKSVDIVAKFKEDAKNKKDALTKKINAVKSKTVDITAKFKDAVTGALNSLIGRINTLINKLKGIKIAGIQPFKDLKTIARLASGGLVNNRGAGVPAVVGEAGPEAVIPLNKRTLSMLAALIMEQVKNSVFDSLTNAIQQVVGQTASVKSSLLHIDEHALLSTVDNGFTKIASQLQAIANSVNFSIPNAVNLIPYKNSGIGDYDIDIERISRIFELSNDELISVLSQLFGKQTADIIAVIKAINLNPTIDSRTLTNAVIDEINRRIMVTGSNPILT